MSTQQALATPVRLDIQPVAGRIGAEIRGVTLSGELTPPPSRRSRPPWYATR